jgi:hypothetical protein
MMGFDPEVVSSVRAFFGSLNTTAERVIWWESVLNSSLSPLVRELLETTLATQSPEFDFSIVSSEEWLSSLGKEEAIAYSRGVRDFAGLVFDWFVKNFGMPEEEIVEGSDVRRRVEEEIDRKLDEARRMLGGAAVRQKRPG